MWRMLPITEVIVTVLPLVIVLLAGIVPSRYEPREPILAHQRWRYRHFIVVWCIFTASQFVPLPRIVMAWGLWLWTLSYGFTAVVIIVSVWGAVRWSQRAACRALGFNRSTALHNLLWALRIVLAFASVATVLGLLTKLAIPNVNGRGFLGETPGSIWCLSRGVRRSDDPHTHRRGNAVSSARLRATIPEVWRFGRGARERGALGNCSLRRPLLFECSPNGSIVRRGNSIRGGVQAPGVTFPNGHIPYCLQHRWCSGSCQRSRRYCFCDGGSHRLWVISAMLFRVSSRARATARVGN